MNTENECAGFAAALVLSADDEWTTIERRAAEHHLARCVACRAQWAAFTRLDQRLLETGAEISAPDPALRIRIFTALRRRERNQWRLALAPLALAASAAWIVLVPPKNVERPPLQAPAVLAASGEVLRIQLTLAPVGDPFLDSSPAESLVVADVAVGSDGRPREIKLVE